MMKTPEISPVTLVLLIVVALLSPVWVSAHSEPAGDCLTYGPTIVTLEGTLVRKTFPGPPNYESIPNGDKPETYWLIRLNAPLCVREDPKDPDVNREQKDLRLIQLVIDPSFYSSHSNLIEKKVLATGTLFGGASGHHHTTVLLNVSTLVRR